jgi:hypothetical protein
MPVDPAGRRATRIAKVVIDVMWWVFLALSLVLVGVFLSAPLLEESGFVARFDWNAFHVDDSSGPPVMELYVSIATDSALTLPSLTSPDTIRASDPVLEQQVTTRLEFGTRRWSFLYIATATLLPFFAAILLGIYLLRSFLADVLATEVFTSRNARRLSTLGWLLIVLGVAGPQLQYWRAWMILQRIQLSGAALSPASSDGNGLWLVGVLVLVLAAAWRYGAELQQERDLTV